MLTNWLQNHAKIITFIPLSANSADDRMIVFLLFSPDHLHAKSNLIFRWVNKKNIFQDVIH